MKRLLILCLPLIFMLCGCGNNSTQSDVNYESVSMSEGIERMANDEGYIMLDVRRVDEFEAGHIPGAVNLPNEEIGNEEIAILPDKEQTIYIYCRSGNRSKQAANKLNALGYKSIVEFGGFMDYTGEIEY